MLSITAAAAGALALILLAALLSRVDLLLRVAGVDPKHVQTVPDRVRYSSMGAIVALTAIAATASLTFALSLVFPGHGWLRFLPVGMVWGAVVFNFDRWIVSSLDYGPITAEDMERGRRPGSASKIVNFLVRFTMAALVGLVISEPIVLAIFGPEIRQQLTAQHVQDIGQQTAQINAAARRELAVLNQPVTTARKTLQAATRRASRAHTIYICELTANCHLPHGEVTGVPGLGPQTSQDKRAWQQAVREQEVDQKILNTTSATEQKKAAALAAQTRAQVRKATATINADNGLLARERALDTLSRENSGFLLRRLLLWLALMFVDLVPVLLKTFAPPTLYEHLQRSDAVRIGRNAMPDAVADADHESAKRAITREFDLEYHRVLTEAEYSLRMEEARLGKPESGTGGGSSTWRDWVKAKSRQRPPRQAGRAEPAADADDAGWVVGQRWHIQRPLVAVTSSGQVPFVAIDLYGEYPFEVVVKIIAPPPTVAGAEALKRRRHAQMEMSLPPGHIHDNIAEVLDCDLDPVHGSYIVTRLYPTTLERYLQEARERDSLTVGEVLHFAVQILAGLRAAWDRRLVHLDLKPANVALTEDRAVKLIDFGLAQHYQKVNGGNDTTLTARFTPFYSPPEQMERRDAAWISRNADIRAFGAVIYRMLTGYPPMFREARALGLIEHTGHYEAAAYADLKELVGTVEPVPIADLIGYAPPALDMLLRVWLRIDPQMRCPGNPESMAERVWLELTAVRDQAEKSGEAAHPAGPRVVREPDFTQLSEWWHRHSARRKTAWAGAASARSPWKTASADPLGAPDFGDPPTVVPGGNGPATTPWSASGHWDDDDEEDAP
jgi:serine/threonine protein kinase